MKNYLNGKHLLLLGPTVTFLHFLLSRAVFWNVVGYVADANEAYSIDKKDNQKVIRQTMNAPSIRSFPDQATPSQTPILYVSLFERKYVILLFVRTHTSVGVYMCNKWEGPRELEKFTLKLEL